MVPSIDDNGYFMVASDGGVFAFGDAHFAGSCPGIGGCSGAAVAVMPDASGGRVLAGDRHGNIYTFGDAPYFGAPGQGTATSAVGDSRRLGLRTSVSPTARSSLRRRRRRRPAASGGLRRIGRRRAPSSPHPTAGATGSRRLSASSTTSGTRRNDRDAGTHLNGAIIAATGF